VGTVEACSKLTKKRGGGEENFNDSKNEWPSLLLLFHKICCSSKVIHSTEKGGGEMGREGGRDKEIIRMREIMNERERFSHTTNTV
jgi:hypothetical protein